MQDSRLLHLNVECAERHSERQRRIPVFIFLSAQVRLYNLPQLALRMTSSIFPHTDMAIRVNLTPPVDSSANFRDTTPTIGMTGWGI